MEALIDVIKAMSGFKHRCSILRAFDSKRSLFLKKGKWWQYFALKTNRLMQTLQEAVLKANLADPELPLVHSTFLFNFRNVVAQNEITATRCPVFNEDLLYLFYRKPGYRVASSSGARTDLVYCPICFILKSSALKSVKRIFPFDSGAFQNGMYGPCIPKEANLDNFS